MPSEKFNESVVAGISYWQERCLGLDDAAIVELDRERQNLFRSVQFGLQVPAAWPAVAEVAVQVVPLVNRRLYRREWIPVLAETVDRFPASYPGLKFDVLIQLGRLQRMERDFPEALISHQAAEALARELADEGRMALIQYNLSRLFIDQYDYDEAERYSHSALESLERSADADRTLVARCYTVLGNVCLARGEFDRANEYLARDVAIWREEDNVTWLARALIDASASQLSAGQLDEAIVALEEAAGLLAPTANELDKVIVGINLGSAYFRQELWERAEETFRKAYSPYLRQSGNLEYQAYLNTSLGNTLLKQGRLIEAEIHMRQAVDLWRQLADDLRLANAVGSLGEVLAGRGEAAAAIPHYDEALSLLEKYGDHPDARGVRALFEEERQKALAALEE